MALRFILQGSRVKSSANPIVGLLGTFNKNLCNSSSSSSSFSCSLHNAGSSIPNITGDVIKTQDVTALCGGTTPSNRVPKRISLAKFAVTKHNENQLWKNLMELLLWKSVHDALSAVGIKRGDLELQEAVMLFMNQRKEDLPRI